MKSLITIIYMVAVLLTFSNIVLAQPNSDMELIGGLEFDCTDLISPIYRDGMVFAGVERSGRVGRFEDFVVYDVSDPQRYRRIVKVPFTDDYEIRYLTLFGQYIVALTWPEKTFLIDISNLNEIEIIGPLNGLNVFSHCPAVVKDSLIFIPNSPQNQGNSQVVVARLVEGPALSRISAINLRGVIYGLSANGNRLACAMTDEDYDDNIDDDKLLLFDISDPGAVQPEASFVYRPFAPLDVTTGFDDVSLSDDFLVTHNHSAYQVVDIRNPASPRLRVNFPAGSDRNHQIWIDGTTVWLTGEGSLGRIDVSDVVNPSIENTHFTYPGSSHILSQNGNQFLFSHGFPYVSDGLSLQDLEDPNNPELIYHFSRTNSAGRLAVSGSLAVVGFQNGFAVLDIGNPNLPQEMSYLVVPNVEGLYFNSSGELIVHLRGQRLVSYDITNPESPREISWIDLDSTYFGSISVENHCYFTGEDRRTGEEGLFVYDVSSGEQMRRTGYLEGEYNYTSASIILDQRLYARVHNSIQTIDISDRANPTRLGSANFENDFYPRAGYGRFLLGDEMTNMNGEKWVVQAEAVREDTLVKIPGMSFRPPGDELNSITVALDGRTFLLTNHEGVTSYRIEWGHRPQATGFYGVSSYSRTAIYGPSNDESSLIYFLEGAKFLILEAANALGSSVVEPVVPKNFAVSAPYPNPFNMSTSLRFELPDAGKLQITIHDASGRLVKQVEIAQPHAGYLTWNWNGNDLKENPVTSGSYFCRIDYTAQSGDHKSTTSKFTALR